ncbi:hypothetical protein TWF192_002237 [Orbilia oligospora]|uniref:Uncharacterized protein n=1 Tax=Orbilia oligospora TaxID=2813651 RepID=A0A6G1MFY1_ORBOL|nr:hypothetical protein TWF679_002330 [Orbilia oligospora]KAF3255797.1 hypothetical protein TWF192_002237 [Orbilia oligospora]
MVTSIILSQFYRLSKSFGSKRNMVIPVTDRDLSGIWRDIKNGKGEMIYLKMYSKFKLMRATEEILEYLRTVQLNSIRSDLALGIRFQYPETVESGT